MSRDDTADESRERRFLIGSVGGVLVTAAGFVALVLALSTNVRDPVTEMPMVARTVAVYGGLALTVVGYVVRRSRWGRRVGIAGFAVFVMAGSTAVVYRSGAPYISQVDRWIIAVTALVLLAVGIRTIRSAASDVGWA